MAAFLVAVGGAFGAVLRYYMGVWATARFGAELPWGTFIVNVSGSFLLGILSGLGASHPLASAELRLLLGTGLIGGFTTYSSFNQESLRMLTQGEPTRAMGYLLATFVTCFGAGAIGMLFSQRFAH